MTHQAGERAVKAIARRLASRVYGDGEEQYTSEQAAHDDVERTLREMGVGVAFDDVESFCEELESVSGVAGVKAVAKRLRAALDKVLKAGG